MSASSDPQSIVREAAKLVERSGGLAPFIRDFGFGGIAYAMILQVIEGIQNGGTLLLGPPRALGRGMIALIDTTIGGLLAVMDAGTAATVRSFTDGTAALLGPLAQPASVGIIMVTLALFMFGVNRIGFSPLSFLQSLRS